jgi:hypothetical protein
VSYPPSPPGSDPNRPQDVPRRPQDTPRNFPTYGRPAQPAAPPYQQQPYQQNPQQHNPYQQPNPQPQNPYQQANPQQQNPYQQQAPAYGQPPAQYGYGYGYGYPGNAGSKVNGLATAALVTGLVGILFAFAAPVAVGLGIAALVQIKRRNEAGTGQAIAGLVIGGVITVLGAGMIALIVAAGVSDDDYGSRPVPTYSPSTTYVDQLAVGECFDDASGEEDEVLRRSCTEPHDGEITADVMMAAGPYPGDRQAGRTAQTRCDIEFGTYIGRPADGSELESSFWHPTEESWDEGDRLVVCAAYGPGGDQLTSTVKGSKR